MVDLKQIALATIKPNGTMSRMLKGYEFRENQQLMLEDVLSAYEKRQVCLIEAGTGVGKSMAYLIPAILWSIENNEKTLISTHTIALQEQLLYKDIPLAKKVLGVELKAALVKGMSNYLCFRKLEDARQEKGSLPDREAEELERIEHWSTETWDGSLSDLTFVPHSSTWERVCAESDLCNRKRCPFYDRCFFFKARQEAESAQLLIANHSLLFADLSFRGEQPDFHKQGLIANYSRVILDEAHHIESVATNYFADRASYFRLLKLLGRLSSDTHGKLALLKKRLAYYTPKLSLEKQNALHAKLSIDLPGLRRELVQQVHDTFNSFMLFLYTIYEPVEENGEFKLSHEVKLRITEAHKKQNVWSKEVAPSVHTLNQLCQRFTQTLQSLEQEIEGFDSKELVQDTESLRFEIRALASRLSAACQTLEAFAAPEELSGKVRWMEAKNSGKMAKIELINARIDISGLLADYLFKQFPSTILCSATLTTNNNFSFIRKRIGLTQELLPLKEVTEQIYASPFDYQKQALLVVPADMPLPQEATYQQALADAVWQAVVASQGNAFVLFTSYATLKQCAVALQDKFKKNRMHLFKQGDESRKALLEQFKAEERSVLFGTDSFWEGVDVAGEKLRLVIIAKLPFKVPTEPIIQARTEEIEKAGGESFFDYVVPTAIVKFKQGFGRLIRNKKDRGCILCLDRRLLSKPYGQLFLKSLPPCRQASPSLGELFSAMQDFYRRTYHLTKE